MIVFLGVSNVSQDFMAQSVPIHVSRDVNIIPAKRFLGIVLAGVEMDTWA